MADMDLSVFRKQRRLMEKRARRKKKKETVQTKAVEVKEKKAVDQRKMVEEIKSLEIKMIEDFALKKDLEKEMKETRMIMYIVLIVTLAIFAFLIGVLVRYVG
jgi:hypothetical protein